MSATRIPARPLHIEDMRTGPRVIHHPERGSPRGVPSRLDKEYLMKVQVRINERGALRNEIGRAHV